MDKIFTPEQEKAIHKLKNRMKNELPQEIFEDDVYIYRFLKARDFSLKHAETMLRKNIQFRKSMQFDTIFTDFKPSEVLQKYIAVSCFGFDKEGCPIRYCALGNTDGVGVLKSSNAFCYWKFSFSIFENELISYKKQSEKLGRCIYQSIFIFNMDHLPLSLIASKHSIQTFMKVTMYFQDNYPEMMKKLYLINTATYAALGWRMIKPVLAPVVRDKVHVYGHSGWKEELLKIIDADVLPVFLGGNRTDPDGNPLCSTYINHVGKVPESYYLIKDIEKTVRKTGMKYIRVEKLSTTVIPIDIDTPKSILNWEFEIKCNDIGFGLTLDVLDEENLEELLPIFRIETEVEPICGMYRCKKMGKYNIVFDNSYSWLHHKDIYYRTWVTTDEGV